ncbi:MAG TPA: LysR family transcriptional regulator [Steroidobacteraceae bacterium]|nr:LysR family transcriptional regulator [Steroidobacteraceae bacterium]
MDRLMALQAFARVVELGGFTKAGDSLQMPKTTVSDLVQGLEKHLGVRLLQRTTRRVTVTSEGAAFYERCASILADLDEAEASVMQARVAPKGRLRVDMPGGLARHVVIPSLPPFLSRYPDLRLELGMGLRTVHLLEEGIDCVIRIGTQKDSSLVARRIGTMSTICCASPAYLRDHGVPHRPEDLAVHRCVTYLSDRTGRTLDWEFARGEQKVQLALEGVLAVNDHDAYIAASLMSLGIVKVANYVVRPYLASGQLTQVLEDWTAEQSPISVMYPQSRHLSAKVRIFVDWVSDLIQQDPVFHARQR